MKKKIKSGKKEKIIYPEPPMKYNAALHKFEPNLPTLRKEKVKVEIHTFQLIIIILLSIIFFATMLYIQSQI